MKVVVLGERNPDLDLDQEAELEALSQMVFFLHFVDDSVPGYDLKEIAKMEQTTVGRFVTTMQAQLESMEDEQTRELYRTALYYGLDAFFGREIKRRQSANREG